MRVSVVQMNAGHDKAKNMEQAKPCSRAPSPPTSPTWSACRRCGVASAAAAPRNSKEAEDLPPPAATSPAPRL